MGTMTILALDPGHTTGWAILTEEKVEATGMFSGYDGVQDLIVGFTPDIAVLENFTLYPWKSQALAWNELRTVQYLGVMKYLLDEAGVPWLLQSASLVKKLSKRLVGYHSDHERDAVTHGIVYLQRQGLATQELRHLIWRRDD